MMNEESVFTQVIRCDRCGKSLFEIAELYKKNICIKCGGCGATFMVYTEEDSEAAAGTTDGGQKERSHFELSELLEIRLHSFELQTGRRGEGAALLFENYVESLFDAVVEDTDNEILKRLQKLFFDKIRDAGMSEGLALLDDIEKVAAQTLRHSGYELIDEAGTEIED